MKVTLPESAIKTLKDILKDNQERPQNIEYILQEWVVQEHHLE